jgi:FixJ family two-component response regulator
VIEVSLTTVNAGRPLILLNGTVHNGKHDFRRMTGPGQKRLDKKLTIAIIDDDDGIRAALQMLLELEGIDAVPFEAAAVFLSAEHAHTFDCLIVDQNMPGMTGLTLAGKLREDGMPLPVILMTANMDPIFEKTARTAGIAAIIQKPFRRVALADVIRTAVHAAGHTPG